MNTPNIIPRGTHGQTNKWTHGKIFTQYSGISSHSIRACTVCPVLKLKGHVAAVLYVNDTGVIHLDLGKEETVEEAHARLQESVLNWGNLLIETGGSLKPSKCFYRLISFDVDEKGR